MLMKCYEYVGFSVLAISSLFFIIATIMNLYMRQALFLEGVNLIYQWQKNKNSILNLVENLFSLLGNPLVIFPILILVLFLVKQRVRSYVLLIFLMAGTYFMALLKLIFQQSRPFWYNSNVDILQWTCPTDFGMPSGHSFIAFAFYEILLSDFFGTGKKRVYLLIWVIIAVGVVISRMYLGAHSLDQVIYGSLIGMSYLLIYKYWLQQFLYKTIKELLNQQKKRTYFIINTVFMLSFIIVPYVSYVLNKQNRIINQTILDNLNAGCGKDFTSEKLQESMLGTQISIYLSVGMIYGFIFLKNQDQVDTLFMIGSWEYKEPKYILMYLGAVIIIVGLPSAILILVIPHFIDVILVKYLLKVLGALYAGFALIYLMSLVQNRFQLITIKDSQKQQ